MNIKSSIIIVVILVITSNFSFSQISRFDHLTPSPEPDWRAYSEASKMREASYERDKEVARECTNQLKIMYASVTNFESPSDGWQEVYVSDNDVTCDIRKVYVSNSKVVTYINGQGTESTIRMSLPIKNAHSFVTLYISETGESALIELFFYNLYK